MAGRDEHGFQGKTGQRDDAREAEPEHGFIRADKIFPGAQDDGLFTEKCEYCKDSDSKGADDKSCAAYYMAAGGDIILRRKAGKIGIYGAAEKLGAGFKQDAGEFLSDAEEACSRRAENAADKQHRQVRAGEIEG